MKIFRLVKPYLFKYKFHLTLFIIISLIMWIVSLSVPYLSAEYIDYISGFYKSSLHVTNDVYFYTLSLFCLWLLEILGNFFFNFYNAKLQCNTVYQLNYGILQHVKRLPILFFNNIKVSYLNQRINSDSNTVVSFVLTNFIQIFMKITTFFVCIFILFTINIKIAAALILLLPVYGFVYIKFRKPLYKSSYDNREKQNKLFSKMNEQLDNIKFIKLNSFFKVIDEQLNNSFSDLYKSTMKYAKLSYIFSSIDLCITRLCNVLLFFYGGFEVINGRLSIGNFININSYFSILLGCTSFFLNLGKNYQDAMTAYSRIEEILNLQVEPNGHIKLNKVDEICLKDVSFSYPNGKSILVNFSYTFKKGNIYCILGRNGIGKSTFVNLLAGLLAKQFQGKIYYDMVEMSELDLYQLREKLVGITEQEPVLLGSTIKNNLTMGMDEIPREKLDMWCRELNIGDFIENLPDNINHNISEKASNISGGQKQKISQTRVFLKEPQVLILDEPTSALDADSIQKLKVVLQKYKEDKIIIIITHNTNLLDIADEILNLEDLAGQSA